MFCGYCLSGNIITHDCGSTIIPSLHSLVWWGLTCGAQQPKYAQMGKNKLFSLPSLAFKMWVLLKNCHKHRVSNVWEEQRVLDSKLYRKNGFCTECYVHIVIKGVATGLGVSHLLLQGAIAGCGQADSDSPQDARCWYPGGDGCSGDCVAWCQTSGEFASAYIREEYVGCNNCHFYTASRRSCHTKL